jgi:ribosomal protein L12E/L44/L45/RPP1/RPP2
MSVFREVLLEWEGKEYKVTPSMALLRSIEMGNISFMDIALRTAQGTPPFSHLATVIAKLLQSAGVNVDEESVYLKLIGGTEKEITSLMTGAMVAFAPQIATEDKKGNKPADRTPAKK